MRSKTASLVVIILIVFLCLSFTKDNKELVIGVWKISGTFCSEDEETPKGYSITFLKDHNGYFQFDKVPEYVKKDNFTWIVKSDTLKLNFENTNGIHKTLFEKNVFTFKELPWKNRHLEIRYVHFRQCGYRLELIKQ